MSKISTTQERLSTLFDADPRNDSAIGAALGVSKQTISAWRNGTRSPKKSMIQCLAERYHTTPEWILGWDLPAPDVGLSPAGLDEMEERLLKAYRAADDRARADALSTLEAHPIK